MRIRNSLIFYTVNLKLDLALQFKIRFSLIPPDTDF